jgi:hypothetical protein
MRRLQGSHNECEYVEDVKTISQVIQCMGA